jgi:hypothetical protein
MCNALPLGIRIEAEAIPPVAENTEYVAAGAISVGVEYRVLTDDIVDGNYAGGDAQSTIDAARPDALDDEGVSLHVCDAETGAEYLRFDAFHEDPHYHYIHPGEYQQIIVFDATACGDMLEFSLECLRSRLPQMLEHAGASELAARLDVDVVHDALPRIVELARTARRAGVR